jgi:anaerobic dimethyl sulfoxide reductase subunit C (anchor subunit)
MITNEWALLIFTILAQLATGMFLVLLIVRSYAIQKVGLEQAQQWIDMPLYLVLPIMVLGLLAALFHLGKLVHVIGAVPNLGSSSMSREVVTAVVFAALVALYSLLQWRKSASEGLRATLGWITALVSLVLLYFMSVTYMLPTQPAWNTFATPVNFYTTAFLLGVLGAACALLANYARIEKAESQLQDLLRSTLQGIAIAAIILLGIEFLALPIYMAYLSTQGPVALLTLHSLINMYGVALFLRLILVFVGAGLLAGYLYRNASLASKESLLANVAYSAFVLVLVSEILGRILFYTTNYRIGI